jgi:hypothetical protein
MRWRRTSSGAMSQILQIHGRKSAVASRLRWLGCRPVALAIVRQTLYSRPDWRPPIMCIVNWPNAPTMPFTRPSSSDTRETIYSIKSRVFGWAIREATAKTTFSIPSVTALQLHWGMRKAFNSTMLVGCFLEAEMSRGLVSLKVGTPASPNLGYRHPCGAEQASSRFEQDGEVRVGTGSVSQICALVVATSGGASYLACRPA